jgi:hypothetical protein
MSYISFPIIDIILRGSENRYFQCLITECRNCSTNSSPKNPAKARKVNDNFAHVDIRGDCEPFGEGRDFRIYGYICRRAGSFRE